MTAMSTPDMPLFRSLSHRIVTMLTAGAFATVAFDFFGQSLSPGLGFAGLAPVPLANQVIRTVTGAESLPGAHALHYMAGMLAYPFGWVFVAEPLRRMILPQLNWLAAAALYGVVLWIFALYVMASLVAGNPPFLGFAQIAWVALVGHVLFAIVTAVVMRIRGD